MTAAQSCAQMTNQTDNFKIGGFIELQLLTQVRESSLRPLFKYQFIAVSGYFKSTKPFVMQQVQVTSGLFTFISMTLVLIARVGEEDK